MGVSVLLTASALRFAGGWVPVGPSRGKAGPTGLGRAAAWSGRPARSLAGAVLAADLDLVADLECVEEGDRIRAL